MCSFCGRLPAGRLPAGWLAGWPAGWLAGRPAGTTSGCAPPMEPPPREEFRTWIDTKLFGGQSFLATAKKSTSWRIRLDPPKSRLLGVWHVMFGYRQKVDFLDFGHRQNITSAKTKPAKSYVLKLTKLKRKIQFGGLAVTVTHHQNQTAKKSTFWRTKFCIRQEVYFLAVQA